MQVRSGGLTGGTHVANQLPGRNLRAASLDHSAVHQVRVKREVTVAVVNHNRISITARGPAGIDDDARIGRVDIITHPTRVIQTVVRGWGVFVT